MAGGTQVGWQVPVAAWQTQVAWSSVDAFVEPMDQLVRSHRTSTQDDGS